MALARKSLMVGVLLALLALMIVPAGAAPAEQRTRTRTWTVTEEQVNSSYRVTNPARRTISDVTVDLQPGQIVISSTHTYPRSLVYAVQTTLVPTVSNGRVTWDVTSVSADGQALPADVQAQINTWLDSSWRNFLKDKYSGRVQSVTITDTDITVTTQGR